MVRVLVADDSATARALLCEILRGDREVEVVGEARDGLEAVELTRLLRPDVVTMDVQMPGMNGLDATKEIMIECPTPIVVVTGVASEDVAVSMHALRMGAVCALQKPPGGHGASHVREARQLVEAVKAMAQVRVVRHVRRPDARLRLPSVAVEATVAVRAVAVAASTGGPAALYQLLTALPADFPAPILIVQHLSAGFVSGLAEWLNAAASLRVKVAEDGERLSPRTVYLAPDGRHLGASKAATVALSDEPPRGGFRPAGTFLFESVGRAFGRAAAAVVLTGMGEDGVAGLRSLRAAGGRVLVQDEKTSVVFGMPGAAVAAGLTDHVLPLGELAPALVALANGRRP